MNHHRLWGVAALTLLALDPITTAVALELQLGIEGNPLLATLLEGPGWWAVVALKGAVLGAVYTAWRLLPEGRAHTWVPAYAATAGALVVVSNLLMTALSWAWTPAP